MDQLRTPERLGAHVSVQGGVEKALEMEPRLRSGTVFLSHMYEAQGEVERAKSLLRKAIERDPEFEQAKDELRRLRSRPAEQSKGGFLSRLLKK